MTRMRFARRIARGVALLSRGRGSMAELLKREWILAPTPGAEREERRVTVMQWNTLADALSASSPTSNFYKAPPECLEWLHRGEMVVKEILRSGADIVCLEEIDHFSDFLQPELSKHGFKGLFEPKIDSPCLYMQPNNGPDGCALFYRASIFDLDEKRALILRDPTGKDSHQVAILAKLQKKVGEGASTEKSPSPALCVAVTHLKAKHGYEENRLAQGKHLKAEMAKFSCGLPVIICGDFNAPPEELVYRHFTSEERSELMLASTYAMAHKNIEPPFTSWKLRPGKDTMYTIDYIWFTPSSLAVHSVWSLPSKDEIGPLALPNPSYPSDHLALCATYLVTV